MHSNDTGTTRIIRYPDTVPVTTEKRYEREAKRYAGLKAWQACHALVLAIYRMTALWPRREDYGLTAQIRRASASSAINIAEGSAKQSRAEFKRFLDIALGSLAEVSCLLELARDLSILTKPEYCELEVLRDHAGKLTWGLYRSLARKEPS